MNEELNDFTFPETLSDTKGLKRQYTSFNSKRYLVKTEIGNTAKWRFFAVVVLESRLPKLRVSENNMTANIGESLFTFFA